MRKPEHAENGLGFVRPAILACMVLFLTFSGLVHAHSPNDGFDAFSCTLAFNIIRSAALQPDGKIIIGGSFTKVSGQDRSRIARLHPNGDLDEDFVPGDIYRVIHGLALQPDGKIIIGGDFTTVSGQDRSRIARLHPNGDLDEDFVPVHVNDTIRALALQPDGKIVIIGGFNEVDGQPRDEIARLHSNGDLDEDFVPAPREGNSYILALALQPDGKIVIGGLFTGVSGQTRDKIARLHSNGDLDQGFIPDLGTTDRVYAVYSIVLQPDGKVIIAYYCSLTQGDDRNRIVRFHPDGALDEDFVPGVYSELSERTLRALTLQPDGRIFVAGNFINVGNDERRDMVRLNPDGSIDDQFISPVFNKTGYEPGIHALAVQPDGKVVVVGSFSDVDGHNPNPETSHNPPNNIVRLYPDGGLELDMLAAVQDAVGHLRINALAVQPDNNAILGGDFGRFYYVDEGYQHSENRLRAVRLKPNGFLDDAFDAGSSESIFAYAVQPDTGILVGKADSISRWKPDGSPDPGGFNVWTTDGAVRAMAVQPDGKILAAGSFENITHTHQLPRNRLIRLDEDGFLDNSFLFTGSSGPTNGNVLSLALQPDGKIIVAGSFTAFDGNPSRKYIVRLHADGSLDTGFNPPALNNAVYAVALQPDGKIVIGGAFTQVDPFTSQRRIARLNPDGSLDTGFMFGVVSNPGMDDVVRTLALQADGKIWAGGDFTSISVGMESYPTTRIVRLHPGGSLDKAFAAGADGDHGSPHSPAVNALAIQADGKVLVGGHFTTLENEERSCIGRLIHTTAPEAAFQELSVNSSGTVVSWIRNGPAPEFHWVSFEQSADGQNYTALGPGTYNQGRWQLNGLNLNLGEGVWVRARGHFSTGRSNGSGSMLESVRYFHETRVVRSLPGVMMLLLDDE